VTERLYRSPSDRVIAGVPGGLATWLNIDPSLVRIAWVLLAVFSGGIFLLVYVVMMIVVPLPPPGWVPRPRDAGRWAPPPGAGQAQGWAPPPGAGQAQGWAPPPGAGQAQGWAPGGGPGPTMDPAAGADPVAGADPGASTGWNTPPPAWPSPPPDWSSSQAAGRAGLVAGAVLVLLGVWFLIDEYIHIDWSLFWPVVIIAAGCLLIVGAVRRAR
jgi:phage shock protein PspC (stress-responsive transcriptional regulator)